jgi:hypothetical protein
MERNGGTAAGQRICARCNVCDELKTYASLLTPSIDSRDATQPLHKTLTEKLKTCPLGFPVFR